MQQTPVRRVRQSAPKRKLASLQSKTIFTEEREREGEIEWDRKRENVIRGKGTEYLADKAAILSWEAREARRKTALRS